MQINLDDDTDPEEASETEVAEAESRRVAAAAARLSRDTFQVSPVRANLLPAPPDAGQIQLQQLLERNKAAQDGLKKAAEEEPIELISLSEGAAPPVRGALCCIAAGRCTRCPCGAEVIAPTQRRMHPETS